MEGHKYLAIFLAFILLMDFGETAPAPKGMGKNTRLAGSRKGSRGNKYGSRNRYGSSSSSSGSGQVLDPALAPCIGLCYHNKLMALEALEEKGTPKDQVAEDDLKFSRGWPLNAAEFDKPCVGVCHYFREMGMVNPFTPKPKYQVAKKIPQK